MLAKMPHDWIWLYLQSFQARCFEVHHCHCIKSTIVKPPKTYKVTISHVPTKCQFLGVEELPLHQDQLRPA